VAHRSLRLASSGFVNITRSSIRSHVYPGMAKYMRLRYGGRSMEDVVIELTEEDIVRCKGVEFWAQTLGVEDYAISTAEKPVSSAQR
jgi:hypothetical protein